MATNRTNYLAQLVVLTKQDSARQHRESMTVMAGISQTLKEVSQNTKDTALLTAEALRLGRETSERVAEILGRDRKH